MLLHSWLQSDPQPVTGKGPGKGQVTRSCGWTYNILSTMQDLEPSEHAGFARVLGMAVLAQFSALFIARTGLACLHQLDRGSQRS